MEIAELYKSEANIEKAIEFCEKVADFFQGEEVTNSADECKQKVAQFTVQFGQYQQAVEIYEEIARHSLNNNLLKYGEMDPTFSGTHEYKLLADVAAAIDEEDIAKFTDVVKEFDSMIPLDSWKTTLLLRVKEKLKAKELEEDDLT